MPNLYALLVGITDYRTTETGVNNLKGCLNDVAFWESYLAGRFPGGNIVSLKNDQATYAEVVRHFGPDHLGRAGADDVVFFAYSGHGSREPAPPEFATFFPEGMMETLVLSDSRRRGGTDLADKELAVLIDRLAQNGAHVAVLLDCCHAGSGTRTADDFTEGAARQTSDRTQPRPLEQLLLGHFKHTPGAIDLPAPRHILLAACSPYEKAYETVKDRGLFTTFLEKVLTDPKNAKGISYMHLFTECRLRAAHKGCRQHPQVETYGYFNGLQGFLGLGTPAQDAPVTVYFKDNAWHVTQGALSGLPTTSAEPAVFELLQNGAPVGFARTVAVGLEESMVRLNVLAQEINQFQARLISTPEPPMTVGLDAPDNLAEAALAALKTFRPLYFTLVKNASATPYALELRPDQARILRISDGFAVRTLLGDDTDAVFKDVFEKLDRMARWEKAMALDNPNTRLLTPSGDPAKPLMRDVEMILSQLDADGNIVFQHTGNEAVIGVLQNAHGEHTLPFRLEVRNNADYPRTCALLVGTSDYRIACTPFRQELPARSSAVAMSSKFVLQDKKSDTIVLQLLVSNRPLHPELLEQHTSLPPGETVEYWKSKGMENFRSGEKTRCIDGYAAPSKDTESKPDWYAETLHIRCAGQQPIGQFPAGVVTIRPHAAFRAMAGLSTLKNDGMAVVGELVRKAGGALVPLGGATDPAYLLELTDWENEAALQQQPLELEVDIRLNPGETPAALTFDGKTVRRVGVVKTLPDGKVLLSLSELPVTEDARRKEGRVARWCYVVVSENTEAGKAFWAMVG